VSACRYHCRSCGGHFASLHAFDAHRSGPATDRRCTYPDAAAFVESIGRCRITGDLIAPVTVVAIEHPTGYRVTGGPNGRETARADGKSAPLQADGARA
jgi:hypothetical protein